MKDVLKFDIKSVKLLYVYLFLENNIDDFYLTFRVELSTMPYIAFCVVIIFSSLVSEKLIQNKILSKVVVSRLFNNLGMFKTVF